MVDESSSAGYYLTGSQSQDYKYYSRLQMTWKSLESFAVEVECLAEEGTNVVTRLRESHLMKTSVLIATVRWKGCKQSCIANDIDGRIQAHLANTYVVLGQQARAKFQVIIQVEGPSSLETGTKGGDRWGLRELFHAPNPTELSVRVLRCGETRSSPRPAAMVIMRRGM